MSSGGEPGTGGDPGQPQPFTLDLEQFGEMRAPAPTRRVGADGLNSGLWRALAEKIGLPLDEIKIIMLNGKRVELDAPVADNDRLAYFPAVGGG